MARKYYIEVSNELAGYAFSTACHDNLKETEKTAKGLFTDLARAYPQLKIYHNEWPKTPARIYVFVWRSAKCDDDTDDNMSFWALE